MKFDDFVKASYPFVWIQTYEEQRALSVLVDRCNQNLPGKAYQYCYDGVRGVTDLSDADSMDHFIDPFDFLTDKEYGIMKLAPDCHANESEDGKGHTIVYMLDFHSMLENDLNVRALRNLVSFLKNNMITVTFISPVIDIPVELEKDVAMCDFELPDVEELGRVARAIIADNGKKITINKRSIEAAKGLTHQEAENAFALSLTKKQKLDKKLIEGQKLQVIKKSGMMEISNPVPIDRLGGMGRLKSYINKRKSGFEDPALPTPRGILMTGFPGTGKSLSSKIIASIFDLPLIRVDISSLKGSYVGESEKNTRHVMRTIDSISPVVVWFDEIEKALGGAQSDGGPTGDHVSTNMVGILLTWMEESEATKYFIGTVNDIGALLNISQGALLRRFDDVFYVDLPNMEERREILKIMNKRYKQNFPESYLEVMEGYTGAEIEKIVKASAFEGIEEAIKETKKIADQNASLYRKLQGWAENNARCANSQTKNKKRQQKRRI